MVEPSVRLAKEQIEQLVGKYDDDGFYILE